ncbi:polysaccharide biosynthesis C-terminal domain-containing protein [Lactiplantibacillus pentosus]|uniref:oligosaccharide flippase family protein n=1 Tax=Lactiplantibacillus pentosus TaxID=1589 RepID=UPI001C1F82FD|nr:polysaccharide biosynthesis C-terminal domain-containing protein [Lactiplantibacillus pentosus]MBU7466092.1 polysaccharide biosynthesis C-terminal domain-containing protein [Lactiplantibacillus pentosus]MDT7002275.1 polysaccharide biosynthesis C-terminal domain-containing protein [Lactiplantibacillus pentosus]
MKIVKNYLYNVGYNILILLTPLLTVPYISRVLGPTGVGINATTNSVITYFLLAGTVGITIYGNREIAFIREDFEKRSQVFWEIELLQITTIGLAYLAFCIFLFFQNQLKMYFFYQSFLIIAGAFDISWFFMGLEDFKKTVLRNILVKIISLFAIFVLVKTKNDVGIYILILSLSQLLGNATLWPYLNRIVRVPKIATLHIFKHLKPSLSLFIPQVAITIYLAVNKTMLWQLDNVTASGYYDYSDKLIKLVLAIVTSTGTVMLPHIANLYARKKMKQVKEYLYISFDFVLFIAIPMCFGIAALATSLAPWFFGSEFTMVNKLLMIEAPVIILIGLSNVIGQQYLLPTKQTRTYTVSVVLGAVTNIVINIPLILKYGVYGAMIATLLSELTVTLYQLIKVRTALKLSKLFANVGKYMFAAVIMFMQVYVLNICVKISAISLFFQIIIGLLIYIGMICILQPSILQRIKKLR